MPQLDLQKSVNGFSTQNGNCNVSMIHVWFKKIYCLVSVWKCAAHSISVQGKLLNEKATTLIADFGDWMMSQAT